MGSNDRRVYAIGASSGSLIWSYKTGGIVYSSLTISNGIVFTDSYDGRVYALRTSSGALLWRSQELGVTGDSKPAAFKGAVYVGSYSDNRVYALHAATGRRIWYYNTRGDVLSSPLVRARAVYMGSSDGRVYALRR